METGLIPDGLDATLVLLRHGESQWIVEGRFQGRSETPLSPLGQRQAELAGARLASPQAAPALPVPIGTPVELVHSPLARTAQTADAAQRALARGQLQGTTIPLRAEDGFAEIGQGDWEGRLHSEITERWGEVLAGWRLRPTEVWAPGGESLVDVRARLVPALHRVLATLGEGRPRGSLDGHQVSGYGTSAPASHPWSIVVGHDGVFKVALLTLFDLPLERFWMFTMALCGISVVEVRAGRPVLRAHNLTEHLAPLLDERAREEADRRQRSGAL